nr:MAG TPA: hypothetical protein [Caudoviricetes sp.]
MNIVAAYRTLVKSEPRYFFNRSFQRLCDYLTTVALQLSSFISVKRVTFVSAFT